jgi:predicted nucleic acid-binding protein
LTRFVLDCSVAVAWCFEDECPPYADAVLERLSENAAMVPQVFLLEVANAFLIGERRRRHDQEGTRKALALIRSLPIMIEQDVGLDRLEEVLSLARDHRLTAYDAAYLELALRHSVPLATLDQNLAKAAEQLNMLLPDVK